MPRREGRGRQAAEADRDRRASISSRTRTATSARALPATCTCSMWRRKKLEALTTDPAFNEDAPAWSPDGRRIAFVRTREKGPDPDGMEDLDVVDVRPGAAPRTLVRPYAPNVSGSAWSPDGRLDRLPAGREPKYQRLHAGHLAVVPAAGGAPRSLTTELDRAVTSYAFAPGFGQRCTITVEDDRTMYPATGRRSASGAIEAREAPRGVVISDLVRRRGRTSPCSNPDDDALPRCTRSRAAGCASSPRTTMHCSPRLAARRGGGRAASRAGRHGDPRSAGQAAGLRARPRYPTLLWIHGGPNGQDEHCWRSTHTSSSRQ